MKTFQNQAAQGDLLITRISSLPEGLEQFHSESGNYVVGHSETGHHHVISASSARVFQAPGNLFVLFVMIDQETILEHLRSYDTHEPLALKPGLYRIDRQREWTPEGFRRAAD